MDHLNTLTIRLSKDHIADSDGLYQYDYGQRLIFKGVSLPSSYEVHFSNNPEGESKTSIGDESGVIIPDEFLTSGKPLFFWVFLHDDETDGETEYTGVIKVMPRAKPTNQEPTPVQQDVITQAIAALNASVTSCEDAAARAEQAATLLENPGTETVTLPGQHSADVHYVNGTFTFEIPTPTATVTKTGHNVNISITDTNGTTSANITETTPQDVIDDTAGAGVINKTWSANKTYSELNTKAPKDSPEFTNSISMGRKANTTIGTNSTALGLNLEASGANAFAEGAGTIASGNQSHAEGSGTIASNTQAHAEGGLTTASGIDSHAEGAGTVASGFSSHAEGYHTSAKSSYSHTEGEYTSAEGYGAHAEGIYTVAKGDHSHAQGYYTQAIGNCSFVFGQYNVLDDAPEWVADTHYNVGDLVKKTQVYDDYTYVYYYVCKTENTDSSWSYSHWNTASYLNYAEIVGNGTAMERSNARTLDWNGNERLAGDLYVHANIDGTGGIKVLTINELPAVATTIETQAVIDEWEVNV